MNKEQKEEFTSLKYARAEQGGFFTPEQKERWDLLFSLHRAVLKEKLQKLDKTMEILEERRLMRLN
jgi:hypothetical protein